PSDVGSHESIRPFLLRSTSTVCKCKPDCTRHPWALVPKRNRRGSNRPADDAHVRLDRRGRHVSGRNWTGSRFHRTGESVRKWCMWHERSVCGLLECELVFAANGWYFRKCRKGIAAMARLLQLGYGFLQR